MNAQRSRGPLRWLVGAAALLLVVAGLWRPAHRLVVQWTSAPTPHERAAPANGAPADRAQVVARVRALLEAGDSAAAMALVVPYHASGDAELVALYREAVAREGRRQRVAELQQVVARQCNEIGARLLAVQFMRRYVLAGGDAAGSPSAVSFVRLPDDELRERVLTHLEVLRTAPDPNATDPLSRARREHRVRVHPDYVAAISATPPEPGLLCGWQMQGAVATGPGRPRDVVFDFWLAPSIAVKGLDLEPLTYVER